jgi:hypothetical protein
MTWLRPSFVAALTVLACAAGAAQAKKVPPAPPEAPAAAGPIGPVALPSRLLADAAAYQAYVDRVLATPADFSDSRTVENTLKTAAASEPRGLMRGAIAYGAVAALGSSSFVADVRAAGATPTDRAAIAGYIAADPAYALRYKGADEAAGRVKAAIGAPGVALYKHGFEMKQTAYRIQGQSWSKQDVPDARGRLAAVESMGENPLAPADERLPALGAAASGQTPLPLTSEPAPPPYTPVVAKALQLAALAALGLAGEDQYDTVAGLASDGNSQNCVHMAKLNLNQCLAVAKPNYEDVFCTGQHAVMDTGSCLAQAAGVSIPTPAPPPAAAPRPASTGARSTAHHRS